MSRVRLSDARDDHLATLLAVRSDQLGVAVPTCPGWDLGRLLSHTGRVYAWVTNALRTAPGQSVPPAGRPPADAIVTWFAGVAGALRATLDAVPADRLVPTVLGDRPASWWHRRMTHETLVHSFDAADALGLRWAPVDPIVAVDGIKEVLEEFVPRLGPPPEDLRGTTLCLEATEEEVGWRLHPGAAHTRVERMAPTALGSTTCDVAVRGPAASLLLLLWGRPATALTRSGSSTTLDRWLEFARF